MEPFQHTVIQNIRISVSDDRRKMLLYITTSNGLSVSLGIQKNLATEMAKSIEKHLPEMVE